MDGIGYQIIGSHWGILHWAPGAAEETRTMDLFRGHCAVWSVAHRESTWAVADHVVHLDVGTSALRAESPVLFQEQAARQPAGVRRAVLPSPWRCDVVPE